jgi:hypothetical protein
MALITVGSVEGFSIMPSPEIRREEPIARGIASARVLSQAAFRIPAYEFEYAVSPDPRGIALKTLRLEKAALKLLEKVFDKDVHVYFVGWSWDMSGLPVYSYPDAGVGAGQALLRIKGAQTRGFLGSGTLLFPPRVVASGMQVRLQIWQSRHGARDFGAAMSAVSQTIADSNLNKLLNPPLLAAGHVGLAIAAAKEAALALAGGIGTVLKGFGDDVLDLYEGNYPANDPWTPGSEAHSGYGTKITLNRLR